MKTKNLKEDYLVITPDGIAENWKSDDFWKMAFDKNHIKNSNKLGYLVSQYDFNEDWKHWENHPNGDEIIYCLSGKMRLVIESNGSNIELDLYPHKYLVVPKNSWHTAKVNEPSKAIFITWGYDTKHKDV